MLTAKKTSGFPEVLALEKIMMMIRDDPGGPGRLQFQFDQSRLVYLVRLISIWCYKWFMLLMTLDMPDDSEGTR